MNNSSDQVLAWREATKKKGGPARQLYLELETASKQPRRGSLPTSRRQVLDLSPSIKKVPSTEVFIPSPTTRLQDTPIALRKFLNTIRPEESSEDDLSTDFGPRPRRKKKPEAVKVER